MIQEQVVVSPISKLKEVRGLEVKDHMAQLVPNPDSLTPAWPHLGHTTVLCSNSKVSWAKKKKASTVICSGFK